MMYFLVSFDYIDVSKVVIFVEDWVFLLFSKDTLVVQEYNLQFSRKICSSSRSGNVRLNRSTKTATLDLYLLCNSTSWLARKLVKTLLAKSFRSTISIRFGSRLD